MKTSKTIEVQWGEIDAAMHVNNVTYLKWVESARVDFLIKMNNGMLVNEEHIGAVVAWLDCKYIRPVRFPDTVRLETIKKEVLTEKIVLETKKFPCLVTGHNISPKYFLIKAIRHLTRPEQTP